MPISAYLLADRLIEIHIRPTVHMLELLQIMLSGLVSYVSRPCIVVLEFVLELKLNAGWVLTGLNVSIDPHWSQLEVTGLLLLQNNKIANNIKNNCNDDDLSPPVRDLCSWVSSVGK